MARIFITGSADGLGLMAGRLLMEQDHQVVLHARNDDRAKDLKRKSPRAEHIVSGDLSDLEQTKALADKVNATGKFDAIIHNAGVYQTSSQQIFSVNTIAPYVLTCLIGKPKRLIYLSSGMHLSGHANFDNFSIDRVTYSDSKLYVMMLALVIAGKWPDVYANAVDPGWVPTKMGGRNAPDDLQKGFETQVWLATSNDEKAKVSGQYFFHKKERAYNPAANDTVNQEKLLSLLETITGVSLPS
jgi:NAD(P)-dependent dehydrogenase (short-subunit alcohol dehydrogenase family)